MRSPMHPRSIVLAALAFALVACGGDSGGGNTDADTGIAFDAGPEDTGPDDTGVDTGPADTGDDTSEDTGVDAPDPPEPAAILVQVTPARAVYSPGLRITPSAIVYGDDGEIMTGVEPEWTVEPAEAATPTDEGAFTLETEGRLAIIGCIDEIEGREQPLCGRREIVVDAGRPQIELTAPEPGAELTFAEVGRGLEVAGRVTDTYGETQLFVNGVRVGVAGDGTFSTTVEPVYGINHVDVVATDLLGPIATRAGADVMIAERYFDVSETTEAAGSVSAFIEQALMFELNQSFLDANIGVVTEPEGDVVMTHDLAGVLELLLQQVDLLSFVPDPVSEGDFDLRVVGFDAGAPQVDITVTTRGLEIYVDLSSLLVTTEGSVTIGDQVLDLDGEVEATVSAFIRLVVRKREGRDFESRVELVDLALEDVTGRFASPQANAILVVAESALATALENVLLDAVNDAFIEQLPELMASAFGEIEALIADQSFELDLGFGPPITLSFDAVMHSLTPERRQKMTARFDATIGTDATPVFDSRGIALDEDEESTEPPLYAGSRVQVGVRMAMINGLLHGLWSSGLLELDATDVLPDAFAFLVDRVELSGQLPPLVRAARPAESDFDILITVGQLEVILGRGAQEDVIGMNLVAGVNADVVDNELVIEVQPTPEFTLWQISVGGDEPLFTDVSDFEALISGVVWPELAGSITEDLVLALPALELSALGDLAPSLADFTLQIVLDRPILIRDGWMLIDGGLDGMADLSE